MGTPATLVIGPDYSKLISVVDPGTAAAALFFLIVLFVGIYTVIAIYHWFRYGRRSAVTIPAVLVHLFVSTGLVLFAVSGIGL